MTTIVLKNRFNHNENGEEIEVDILDREFDDDLEKIKTDKGLFLRKWEEHGVNDPFGWVEYHD